MTVFQAIVLGIIQGLTEFLPISSSAHLNIMPWLFNWQEIPEAFDIALHFGTLLAICIYFFKDWIDLLIGGYKKVVKKEDSTSGRIFWYIVIATIPTGILSLVLDAFSEKYLPGMAPIAVALIVMGILLYIIDKKAPAEVDYDHINFKQGFLIGLSQAIAAAFPGVSRSGITMTVSGLLVIKFLMGYLKKGSFKIFAVYRVILGLIIFAVLIMK